MNWIKNSTFHTFVLHLILLFCVCILSAHAEEGDPPSMIDADGLLTIGTKDAEDTAKINLVLDSNKLVEMLNDQPLSEDSEDPEDRPGLTKIIIEQNGTLEIAKDTDVLLGGKSPTISINEGNLIINLDAEDRLHGLVTTDEDDNETSETINISFNGGTIKIQDADNGGSKAVLNADIFLGSKGGMIGIEEGLTYTIGTIMASNGSTGNFTKEGAGTLVVDEVKIGGTFDVKAGDVFFSNNVSVVTLDVAANSSIDGSRDDDKTETSNSEDNSTLTVTKGGKIQGTLQNFSELTVRGGTLELVSESAEHKNIGHISISKDATLDLQAGAIQIADSEAVEDTDTIDLGDIVVAGTLQITEEAKIYKGDKTEENEFKVTLSGSTDSDGNMANGVIKIIASDPESPSGTPIDLSKMQVQVYGAGGIDVAKGVTLKTGGVEFIKDKEQNLTGGTLYVSGEGIYETESVDLGTGWLYLKEKTTMKITGSSSVSTLESEEETPALLVQASILIGEAGSKIIADGNAKFDFVGIPINGYANYTFAGDYDGGGNNLIIEKGGRITGHLTGIDELHLSGDYLLTISPENDKEKPFKFLPIIDAGKVVIEEGKTTIRVVGMGDDLYKKIFHVTEGAADLVAALNNGVETALYRPTWQINEEEEGEEDGHYIDLDLNVLSVDEYVSTSWHKSGADVNAAAQLLENLAVTFPEFRVQLEGLSHEQLQSGLKNIMAGKLAGNALQMALRPPAQSVFRHLDTVVPLRSPFSRSNYRGQIREGFNVWFTPFGQSETADSDGNSFDGYDMTRFGFHLGGDIEIYNRAVLGALFSYSSPQIKSELGKVSANDYTAGVYLRMPTAWAVVANMMIGFGNQDYTYENFYGDADFRGGSFFASAELTRPVSFRTFQLTPLIAFDYQSAEMDSFILMTPGPGWTLVAPDDVSQTALRIGLLGNAGRFRGRLQYTRQLSGEDSVASRTMAGDLSASTVIRSSEWGKDWINVGVGGELLRARYWRIFADYNFDLGKHTTSHTGSLNSVLTW